MTTTTNFKIGQKVVCVDFSGFDEAISIVLGETGKLILVPKRGITYTIREVMNDGDILLCEIVNQKFRWKLSGNIIAEPSFLPSRFRPLTYKSCSATLAASVLTTETSDMPLINPNPSPKPEKKEVII